jgi:hypothetical protein
LIGDVRRRLLDFPQNGVGGTVAIDEQFRELCNVGTEVVAQPHQPRAGERLYLVHHIERSSEEQEQAGNGRNGKNNEIRRNQEQNQRGSQLSGGSTGVRTK